MATLNSKNISYYYGWQSDYESPNEICLPSPNFDFIFTLRYIRVATSKKANKIDIPDTAKIVTKILSNNARVLSVLVDFLSLD